MNTYGKASARTYSEEDIRCILTWAGHTSIERLASSKYKIDLLTTNNAIWRNVAGMYVVGLPNGCLAATNSLFDVIAAVSFLGTGPALNMLRMILDWTDAGDGGQSRHASLADELAAVSISRENDKAALLLKLVPDIAARVTQEARHLVSTGSLTRHVQVPLSPDRTIIGRATHLDVELTHLLCRSSALRERLASLLVCTLGGQVGIDYRYEGDIYVTFRW